MAKFICPDCGKTLHGSAVCTDCDNKEVAEKERAFKDLANSIAEVIKASRVSLRATVKNSGFSVKDLLRAGLDPEAASFLKPVKRKKTKNRIRARKKSRENNK